MHKITVSLSLLACAIFAGCASVPPQIDFYGRSVPTVSAFSVGKDKPYPLAQDYSSMVWADRMIDFKGTRVRVAGSADGKVVMLMADTKMDYKSMIIANVAQQMEAHFATQGIKLLEIKAAAMSATDIAAYYLVFDQDVYTSLKAMTVE